MIDTGDITEGVAQIAIDIITANTKTNKRGKQQCRKNKKQEQQTQ